MQERGQPAPSWYEEEPDIPPRVDFFLRAFWELSTERQIGFSVGPIPMSKIEEKGSRHGFDEVTKRIFRRVIRELDTAYLDWLTKEREKKNRKRKK